MFMFCSQGHRDTWDWVSAQDCEWWRVSRLVVFARMGAFLVSRMGRWENSLMNCLLKLGSLNTKQLF